MKPFIKWAGGKAQFLPEINYVFKESNTPEENTYIEPFVGGGAALFSLEPLNFIINDINSELIKTYREIKTKGPEVNEQLKSIQDEFNALEISDSDYSDFLAKRNYYRTTKEGKYEYFDKRNEIFREKKLLYDRVVNNFDNDWPLFSTRFIFLNKTGFNGLYRVNSQGKFNVPFSYRKDINIYDEENILLVSDYLKKSNSNILNEDFRQIIEKASENDFIFCDPPYDTGFTSYTKDNFTQQDQIELRDKLFEASEKGVKWLTTNHPTDFIKEIYSGQNIYYKELPAYRFISSKSSSRSKENNKEIFIINFQADGYKKLETGESND